VTTAAAAVAAVAPAPVVTLDSGEVEQALAAGRLVVCVQPPSIEYPSFHQADLTWELYVMSGPAQDRAEAWRRIDAVLSALAAPASGLSIESADPSNYQPRNGHTVPAYIVTLSPETQVTA
jgi:hypothetical protein